MKMRLFYHAALLFVVCNCLGCMGLFLPMFFSPLSQDNQNQLDLSKDDPQSHQVLYYTRLEPPMFDDTPKSPQEQSSGLSSQDIRGTPMPNGIEIQRSDLLQEVKNTEQKRVQKPDSRSSFHTLLNDCAKNDLFNELGAHLNIKADEKKQCARLENRYYGVLNKHYKEIAKRKARVLILLQDLVSGCSTHQDRQAILQSPFFKRLAPHITTRREKAILRHFTTAKPLKRDGLHALLEDKKLGERFYRCQYFIHAP